MDIPHPQAFLSIAIRSNVAETLYLLQQSACGPTLQIESSSDDELDISRLAISAILRVEVNVVTERAKL